MKASALVKIGFYFLLALVALIRVLAAFPLVVLAIGADIAGDDAWTDRLDGWIERIVGPL